jgi:autotransporter family porin
MNKGIYRLVWNRSLGALQVVSEMARSRAGGSGRATGVKRRKRAGLGTSLALLALGVASANAALASPFIVTNGFDSGAGSLRQAILDANADGNTGSVIEISVDTITLNSALPILTDSVFISLPGEPVEIFLSSPITGGGYSLITTGVRTLFFSTAGRFVGRAGDSGVDGGNGNVGASGAPASVASRATPAQMAATQGTAVAG